MRQAISIDAFELCSGLGRGQAASLEALRDSRDGLGPPPMSLPFDTFVGQVPGEFAPLPAEWARHDTRLTRLAAWLYAGIAEPTQQAINRFGADRLGLFLATSTAGIAATETAYDTLLERGELPAGYSFVDQHAYHPLLVVLRGLSGIGGPGHVISTACSSSGKVFASAARMIASGFMDAAVVGGVDTLCQTTLRGFFALGALSVERCKPFSAERSGINIGEGGALLLLSRDGPGDLALLGFGETSDAWHMSAPHPEGIGALSAMGAALRRAGLGPGDVDHVNAHGTGTRLNDSVESQAIARLLGDQVPVTSTKAWTGHLLGAAGAVEAALSALCLRQGLVPAALRATPVDGDCPAHVPAAAEARALRCVMSNSFAFGGNNVSLLLGRA